MIRGLALHEQTHYAADQPSKTILITYMSRRPTAQWPERKYCDDLNSFFLCRFWATFGERSLGRMVINEAELVQMLKSLESEPRRDGKTVVINVVNFNELSFEQQVAEDLKTDIMIGPHGAGLTHSAFMRDRARLVELFVDGSGGNRHFHNMAFWYGRGYHELSCSNPVDIQSVKMTLNAAIDAVDINRY